MLRSNHQFANRISFTREAAGLPDPCTCTITSCCGKILAEFDFHNGPLLGASDFNGVIIEDLIAVALDRLEGLNQPPYNCRENSIAITKLEEALLWLNKRTADRQARGVEGTHTP